MYIKRGILYSINKIETYIWTEVATQIHAFLFIIVRETTSYILLAWLKSRIRIYIIMKYINKVIIIM